MTDKNYPSTEGGLALGAVIVVKNIDITYAENIPDPSATPKPVLVNAPNDTRFINEAMVKFVKPDGSDYPSTTKFYIGTNGSEPNMDSPMDNTQIKISETTTYRVIAVEDGLAPSAVSAPVTFTKLDVKQFASIRRLTTIDIQNNPENVYTANGKLVTITSPVVVIGVYKTQMPGTWFAYLRDTQFNANQQLEIDRGAIKLVVRGAGDENPFPDSWIKGREIGTGGIVGMCYLNEGDVADIEVRNVGFDFLSMCAGATIPNSEVDTDPFEVTKIDRDAFNHLVALRNVKIENNRITTPDGTSYQLYGRLTEFTGDLSKYDPEKRYRVEGFVGQVNGLALFPLSISECPAVPQLYAPNLLNTNNSGNSGSWQTVNYITDNFDITIGDLPEGTKVYYRWDNRDLVISDKDNPAIKANAGNLVSDGKITFNGVAFHDKYLYLTIYTKLNGVTLPDAETVALRFKYQETSDIASIAKFKERFLGKNNFDYNKLEGVNGRQHLKMTGEVVVVARTPEYIYVMDRGANPTQSSSFLMIRNTNEVNGVAMWDVLGIEPGDVLSGFYMSPDRTTRYNLISNSTNFGRTFKKAADKVAESELPAPTIYTVLYQDATGADPDNGILPAADIAFGENDRMRRFTLKGVRIREIIPGQPTRYLLDLGAEDAEPVEVVTDIFRIKGGWATVAEPGVQFDLTGLLIRNDESISSTTVRYAIAMMDFEFPNTTAEPLVFPADAALDDDAKRADSFTFATTATVMMEPGGEDAKIYYTVNGTDPLQNPDDRLLFDKQKPLVIGETSTIRAYAARPGMNPSPLKTVLFKKTSSEAQFILNFLNNADENTDVHFRGKVNVVAVGTNMLFVKGKAGHYLQVYDFNGWSGYDYKPGDEITDFVIRYAEEDGNIFAKAAGSFPATGTPDPDYSVSPDMVTAVSEANLRRHVQINSAEIVVDGSNWKVVGAVRTPDGTPADLAIDLSQNIHSELPAFMTAATQADEPEAEAEPRYVVTGFVSRAADGSLKIMPTSITAEEATAPVTFTVDGIPMTDLTAPFTFYPSAQVTLACADKDATIYYTLEQGPEANYFVYGGRPIGVDRSLTVTAYAVKAGKVPGNPVALQLARRNQMGDVEFEVITDPATGVATVTLRAKDNDATIHYAIGDGEEKVYSKPFTLEATAMVSARLTKEGNADGEVCRVLITVTPVNPTADGSVDVAMTNLPEGGVKVTLKAVSTDPDAVIYATTSKTAPLFEAANIHDPAKAITVTESTHMRVGIMEHGRKSAEQTVYIYVAPDAAVSQPVSGRVIFEVSEAGEGAVKVTIKPEAPLADDTYDIYYTTKEGVTLTDKTGTHYDGPVTIDETCWIMAILVETGKQAGAMCQTNVWVATPTGIDGTDADADGAIRVEGSEIIAPEGSEIYDLSGRRVASRGLQPGVYIVRSAGAAVKVVVR